MSPAGIVQVSQLEVVGSIRAPAAPRQGGGLGVEPILKPVPTGIEQMPNLEADITHSWLQTTSDTK